MTAKAAKTTALHNCECSNWEFNLGEPESDQDYSTGCTAQTTRVFAQGHDAKLVGFLVRAEIANEDISKREGGMLVTYAGAVDAAASISDALAAKTAAMLDAHTRRLAAKATRKAAKKADKAETPAAPVPAKREAKIKVGRWTYDATIDPAGIALYNTKLGLGKSAKPGEYTEV